MIIALAVSPDWQRSGKVQASLRFTVYGPLVARNIVLGIRIDPELKTARRSSEF
jgi:hypothetical protein